jgi:hypothetical protein
MTFFRRNVDQISLKNKHARPIKRGEMGQSENDSSVLVKDINAQSRVYDTVLNVMFPERVATPTFMELHKNGVTAK